MPDISTALSWMTPSSFWKHVAPYRARRTAQGGGLERRRRSQFYGADHEPVVIAVFIPSCSWRHRRRLFQEFAVTLSAAVLVSLLVSLTTTRSVRPMAKTRRPSARRFYYRSSAGTARDRRMNAHCAGVTPRPLMMILLLVTIDSTSISIVSCQGFSRCRIRQAVGTIQATEHFIAGHAPEAGDLSISYGRTRCRNVIASPRTTGQ